jgi:NAD-dependent SIR2 family protein deacetylase
LILFRIALAEAKRNDYFFKFGSSLKVIDIAKPLAEAEWQFIRIKNTNHELIMLNRPALRIKVSFDLTVFSQYESIDYKSRNS